MLVNPVNATAQYDATQDLRSVNRAPGESTNQPDEPPTPAAGSVDDPAVTTTISPAALETARAAAPPERSAKQNSAAGQDQQKEVSARDKPSEDRVDIMV